MAKGDPQLSPWVWTGGDYLDRIIRITVTFDNVTRAITGITVFRDAGCLFTKLLIGLGVDGAPDSTDRLVTVPAGTTVLSAGQRNQLASRGLNAIEDILALQITAGR